MLRATEGREGRHTTRSRFIYGACLAIAAGMYVAFFYVLFGGSRDRTNDLLLGGLCFMLLALVVGGAMPPPPPRAPGPRNKLLRPALRGATAMLLLQGGIAIALAISLWANPGPGSRAFVPNFAVLFMILSLPLIILPGLPFGMLGGIVAERLIAAEGPRQRRAGTKPQGN